MTKRIPGARRGRPPKPKESKPTKRRRGRPNSRVPLCQHPERYVVAWTAAMTLLVESGRGGAFLSLRDIVNDGKKEPDEHSIDRLRKRVESFQTPADLAWRKTMAETIFIAAMIGPLRPQLAINAMLRRAASVGEAAWARRILLPHLLSLSTGPISPETDTSVVDRVMARFYSQARQRAKTTIAA